MRDGDWPRGLSVVEVSARAVIGGVTYEAESVSIDREIPSTMPAQTMTTGGYSPARARLTIINGPGVAVAGNRAWSSRLPVPGESAQLFVVHEGQSIQLFRGLVDEVSGSATSQAIDVTLVDETDRLNQDFSNRAMAAVLAPTSTTGTGVERYVDLHTTWLVDRALRNCGYYATPDRMGYCFLDVPFQGSAWPAVGSVDRAQRTPTEVSAPYWGSAGANIFTRSIYARYFPDFAQWGGRDGTMNYPLEFVFGIGSNHGGSGRIWCEWPDGTKVGVAITGSRSVVAQFQWPGQDWTTILSKTEASLGGRWNYVSVRFTPDSEHKAVTEIRTDTGGYARRTGSSLPYRSYNGPMESIVVNMPDNPIRGLQIGAPGNPSGLEKFTPSAVLSPPVPYTNIHGTPEINGESSLELLKEWSQAEATAMWLDEDGVFRWVNRERFIDGPIVWEGDSLNDLLEVEWSHDLQGAARRAIVKYKEMAIQRTRRSRIKVWEGSGDTMEFGDTMEDIITSPDDEIWIDVDSSPQEYQAETTKQTFAQALGSWWGYVAYDKDGKVHDNTEWVGYKAAIELIANSVWKITQTWNGNAPQGVEHIKLSTQAGNTALPAQWWDQNLPLLRARIRMVMADAQVSLTGSGNRSHPDLIHEAGWWLQRKEQARSLAGWMASRLRSPLPVIEEIEIAPDPRLQLGDKIRLTDSDRLGMMVTGVITRLSHSIADASHEMTVGLLVTATNIHRPVLADFDQVWESAALQDQDAQWRRSTLRKLDADPLRRTS